jgi:hypothetical protein
MYNHGKSQDRFGWYEIKYYVEFIYKRQSRVTSPLTKVEAILQELK